MPEPLPELEPTVEAVRYAVSCLPIDHPQHRHFTVYVEWRGNGRWAVTDGAGCFTLDGEHSYESIPSTRSQQWLARHRFDLPTALALAKRLAPGLTAGGVGVAAARAR
ncbi:hypothetical protein [Nocardia asiatica]|uniref:hypothetical protein n=1 Tax=Nocardia asiatica TaxID=209252 RepID=UPI0012F8FC24|nr:hypothetical protein [Nocardia asiatica]